MLRDALTEEFCFPRNIIFSIFVMSVTRLFSLRPGLDLEIEASNP